MKRLSLLLLLSVFSVTAFAETEWIKMDGLAGSGNESYVDADRIKTDQNKRKTIWVMETTPEPRREDGKIYSTIKIRVRIDCKNDTYQVFDMHFYKKNGSHSLSKNEGQPARAIIPESMADKWKEYVCE